MFNDKFFNNNFNILKEPLISDKIKLEEHLIDPNTYMLRLIKTRCFLDYPIEDSYRYIGCLDYFINKNDNFIKIDYLYISDNDYSTISPHTKDYSLNDCDALYLKKSLLKYVENIALTNNINKIIIDVHHNLKNYNKLYFDEGFIVSDFKCSDNPCWIEAVKILNAKK